MVLRLTSHRFVGVNIEYNIIIYSGTKYKCTYLIPSRPSGSNRILLYFSAKKWASFKGSTLVAKFYYLNLDG